MWFFLRGDGEPSGDGDGGQATAHDFREQLLAEYKPMVQNMRKLITALAPIDAGEEMTTERIAAARAQQDTAQAHYDAIDALPTPPEELKQDFVALRPTLNEFVALSGRTIEWLEGTEPAKPTDTPRSSCRRCSTRRSCPSPPRSPPARSATPRAPRASRRRGHQSAYRCLRDDGRASR